MLIAFYSYGRRAGKNTAGDLVGEWCQDHNIEFEQRAFAAKGKLLAAEILGVESLNKTDADTIAIIDAFKLYGRVDVHLDASDLGPGLYDSISGRDFLINLMGDGDEAGARKLFGPEFWINQCLPVALHHKGAVVVVTDLRWDTEVSRVHYLGGYVVEVLNDRAEFKGDRAEHGLGPGLVDYQIDNNGTLDELRETVRLLMGHIPG